MTTVTGNLMSQFHVLSNYELPAKDSIVSHDSSNQVIADSCDIQLFYSSFLWRFIKSNEIDCI